MFEGLLRFYTQLLDKGTQQYLGEIYNVYAKDEEAARKIVGISFPDLQDNQEMIVWGGTPEKSALSAEKRENLQKLVESQGQE